MRLPGNWGALKGWVYRLRYAVGSRLGDHRYILQLTEPAKLYQGDPPQGVEVRFHDSLDSVSDELIAEIEGAMGRRDYRRTLERLFESGGRLCVATVDGRLGSLGWTKTGRHIPKWHVPLDPTDVVITRDFTAPQMRGRHLHAVVLAARCQDVAAGRYLTDCHVQNTASLRAFARSGWSVIGKVTLR